MSGLEDGIMRAWEAALVEENGVAPELAHAVAAELATLATPNADRIAEIIRGAAPEGRLS